MNLYKISQDVNNSYDTYDSAIVAAETKEKALFIHPDNRKDWDGKDGVWSDWTSWDKVKVEFIGTAEQNISGVILSSYNAG